MTGAECCANPCPHPNLPAQVTEFAWNPVVPWTLASMSNRWEGELRGEVGQDHSLQIWRPNDEALLQLLASEQRKSKKTASLAPVAAPAQAQAQLPEVVLPPAPLSSAALYSKLLKATKEKEKAAQLSGVVLPQAPLSLAAAALYTKLVKGKADKEAAAAAAAAAEDLE